MPSMFIIILPPLLLEEGNFGGEGRLGGAQDVFIVYCSRKILVGMSGIEMESAVC